MIALGQYPVYFGNLSGQKYPFYGDKRFSISTKSFGDPPDFRYAYEHYKLVGFSGLISREYKYAWIPSHMDEGEAIEHIRQIQFEAETRLRFGIKC
jgi:hypothetical protein